MSDAYSHAVALEAPAKAVISLEGDFLRPLTVDLAEFREQPNVVADPFDLRCYTTNRFIRSVDTYRGVLLKDLIMKALEETGGNVTRAARLLQISRKSLQTKMKEFGLRDEAGEEEAAENGKK